MGDENQHRGILGTTLDGRPRSYRDDPKLAREAARYLKSKNANSDVSVRDCVAGEVLSFAAEHAAVSWVDTKKAPR